MTKRLISKNRERKCLQRIAYENRRSFIVGTVAGWPATPQVIVVHRRKIIMDEAVNMDQLNRSRRGIEIGQRRAERFARQINESGSQSFATTQGAVSHRLAQPLSAGVREREASVEHLLDSISIGFYAVFECGHA
jgi:hypothetical protein